MTLISEEKVKLISTKKRPLAAAGKEKVNKEKG
jgi:hypothetical protein